MIDNYYLKIEQKKTEIIIAVSNVINFLLNG